MKTFYVLLAAAAYVAAAAGNRRVIIKLKSHDPAVTSFVTAHVAAQQASSLDSLGPADAVHEQFNTTHFAGLAGSFSDDFLQRLNTTHADTIDYVEEDHAVQAYVQQARAPWGLARLSATGGQVYAFPPSAGAGVDVYVLDSGVQVDHPDLEGRATMVANYVPGEDNRDYTGHGTHIAGTIASKTFGVAKKARVLGIKVLDKSGMGYDSRIISGITYAINHRRAGVKTVINMSLGGKKSRALDEAVAAAVKAGVVVVVAAGNEHMDACQLSPSGARDAFAVGAADQRNRIAHFSNYGPCVQMYAPGVQIASTSNERGQTVRYMTGTSMASPHAAGIAALLMADQEFSSARDVMRAMTRIAKPFAKENDGHALLMASVPTGGQVRQDQANTSMDTPAETTPSHRTPVQQRPSPSQDDTARPQPAPVHRAPSTDTAPSHSVPVQRPSPSQDDLARQPTPTHRAPVQKRPSPSQDGTWLSCRG
jgi:subtilisin family serine protease